MTGIKELMKAGRWDEALRIASTKDTGPYKERISRAWAAIQNPEFYREIGKDPDVLRADGLSALMECFND